MEKLTSTTKTKQAARVELLERFKERRMVPLEIFEGEFRMRRVGVWSEGADGAGAVCTSNDIRWSSPVVYVVVAELGDGRAEVLYAGRGVDGWEPRRKAHQGNVGSDNKPRRFHTLILKALGRSMAVATYAREAAWTESDGQRVSTYDAEEQGLIARFCPSINSDAHKLRLVGWQVEGEDQRLAEPVAVGRVDLTTGREAWIGAEVPQRPCTSKEGIGSANLRVAVLGLSHHGDIDGPTMTPDVVRELAFDACEGSAFFVKIASMISGMPAWELDRRRTWERIAFANYVDALLIGPRVKPSVDDFAQARRLFVSKLAQLRPELLVVLGSDTWNNLPGDIGGPVPAFRHGGTAVEDGWVYPWSDDGEVTLTLAIRMPHPSGSAWRRDEVISRFRAAAASSRAVLERFGRQRSIVA